MRLENASRMSARSLVDVLQTRAAEHGERPLYQQVVDGEIVGTLTYAQADRRARTRRPAPARGWSGSAWRRRRE